jgi:plastocyanin
VTGTTTAGYAARGVLAAGAVTALAVVGVAGCERQSPRFDNHAPATSAPVTASVAADGAQRITLQMTDLLRFEPSDIHVRPGKLTVTLVNAGQEPHTFEVPDLGVNTGNIPLHTTKSITFTVPPGAKVYHFDCAYHTSEHMVGTITVTGF